MTREALQDLMKLNQLSLTAEEQEHFLQEYQSLLQMEACLDSCDVSGVEPLTQVVELVNVLREDVAEQPFSRESLQAGAPDCEDGYWQVPRLLE